MIAPRNERLIAIGDIHGCLHALNALLDAIDPQPEDLIVTLGDYVDRGPNSAGVLDRLIRLSQQTRLVCLLGNHEEMMIDTYTQHRDERMWMRYGGIETMQ
ncbi:MAG: metallophosphoesterase family protein, partial [Planctomycetota bacterium]